MVVYLCCLNYRASCSKGCRQFCSIFGLMLYHANMVCKKLYFPLLIWMVYRLLWIFFLQSTLSDSFKTFFLTRKRGLFVQQYDPTVFFSKMDRKFTKQAATACHSSFLIARNLHFNLCYRYSRTFRTLFELRFTPRIWHIIKEFTRVQQRNVCICNRGLKTIRLEALFVS